MSQLRKDVLSFMKDHPKFPEKMTIHEFGNLPYQQIVTVLKKCLTYFGCFYRHLVKKNEESQTLGDDKIRVLEMNSIILPLLGLVCGVVADDINIFREEKKREEICSLRNHLLRISMNYFHLIGDFESSLTCTDDYIEILEKALIRTSKSKKHSFERKEHGKIKKELILLKILKCRCLWKTRLEVDDRYTEKVEEIGSILGGLSFKEVKSVDSKFLFEELSIDYCCDQLNTWPIRQTKIMNMFLQEYGSDHPKYIRLIEHRLNNYLRNFKFLGTARRDLELIKRCLRSLPLEQVGKYQNLEKKFRLQTILKEENEVRMRTTNPVGLKNFQLLPDPHCTACGNQKQPHFRCSACKCNFYCSRKCQTRDWNIHKKFCQRVAVIRKSIV